jgi:hypothetical protein
MKSEHGSGAFARCFDFAHSLVEICPDVCRLSSNVCIAND